MKSTFSQASFGLALALVLCFSLPGATQEISLNGGWQLQSADKISDAGAQLSQPGAAEGSWHTAQVPTTVLAALVADGTLPDPYFGENLKKIPGYREDRWLVMPDGSPFKQHWWFRRGFEVPAGLEGRHLVLHFDGINYEANIYLNGKQIAAREDVIGMFRRFEFDVTDKVRYGETNGLAVEIIPPGQMEDKEYRTKQLEATTGWDDHNPYPPDLNMGIWEDVFLTANGPLRVQHPYVVTDLELPDLTKADLTVSAYVTNVTDTAQQGEVSGRIGDIAFTKEVSLAPGEKIEVIFTPADYPQLIVHNPRLWWPHPVGGQPLYTLDLTAAVNGAPSDAASTRFGIREIETYINDEDWRVYTVNGRRILIRGGAWMTSDMMLQLDQRRYDALVGYARHANLNMLRSEGFSIRETKEFYDACDELGVMVTQQIFGRSIPDEELAMANIDDMMLRIRNHPSLAHFLGHDETFPTPTLDAAYKDMIEKYRVNRTYQPHSGAFDVAERAETGGTRTGTRELWTYANPNHYYTHKDDGAWGFAQSGGIGGIFASLDSLKRMLPEDALWPPFSDAYSFHTVSQSVEFFNVVFKMMDMQYGKPGSIEELTRKGEVMNYASARGMYEAYARNKYDASGITTWKYDAAWPAALTWQYVDWYLVPTAAYYGAKKACEPVHALFAYDDESVYVVNTYYHPRENLLVTATVYNFDCTEMSKQDAVVDVGEDGKVKAFAIEWPDGLSETHFLKLVLKQEDGDVLSDNFYWLSTSKDVPGEVVDDWRNFDVTPKSAANFKMLNQLPEVAVTAVTSIDGVGDNVERSVLLTNDGESLAFAVRLAIIQGEDGEEAAPAFWSENYVCLLPGETKHVTVDLDPADLNDASPVLEVTGWNIGKVNVLER